MNKQDIEALKDTGLDLSFIEKTRVVQVIREANSLDDALKLMNGLAANGWLRQWDNAKHDDGSSWRDKELTKPQEAVAIVEVWNEGGSGRFVTAEGVNRLPHGTKLYTAPPNYEALLKDNERLREAIGEASRKLLKSATPYDDACTILNEALKKGE